MKDNKEIRVKNNYTNSIICRLSEYLYVKILNTS